MLIHLLFAFLLLSLTILILVVFSYFMYYWTHTLPLMNGGYIYPGIHDTKGVEIIREKNVHFEEKLAVNIVGNDSYCGIE